MANTRSTISSSFDRQADVAGRVEQQLDSDFPGWGSRRVPTP
jgi:hypothetical protein